jgi:DNA-binding CsgD family transcriptional regulator
MPRIVGDAHERGVSAPLALGAGRVGRYPNPTRWLPQPERSRRGGTAERGATGAEHPLAAECEGVQTPALRRTIDPRSLRLTRREWEIAELAAGGDSNSEIAARLRISVRTVESHLYHAMTKLGVTRRHELPTG